MDSTIYGSQPIRPNCLDGPNWPCHLGGGFHGAIDFENHILKDNRDPEIEAIP